VKGYIVKSLPAKTRTKRTEDSSNNRNKNGLSIGNKCTI
jgi:hypothetical protein